MGTSIGKDVPAFVTVAGSPAVAKTINTEGLRRRGFDASAIAALRRAFKIVYRQGLTLEVALDRLQTMVDDAPSIQMLIDSLKQSQRGIVR
jgi:UDP-N-acetylglucosamine acyltransferase